MKDFLRILRRFVPPYKKFMVWNVIFNVLSAILNLFSFALIIPILNILFKISDETYTYTDWTFAPFSFEAWKATPELLKNNFFWFVSDMIETKGGSFTLIILGVFLIYFLEGRDDVYGFLYDDPDPYGCRPRHPQSDQPQDNGTPSGLFLGRAEGGYNRTRFGRCERDRDFDHEFA